ncbi:hypothetical protein D9758_004654 [Tetrapyrgos nigripes]|uniref:Uncharacterized protein n=1 Tax=Tetrapyrgos nigripes TaxID=182062 RepID=A0A8H5H0G0_9AGAR|nr:hypothetical protein D9758_004654 [Tetrapyrgos nigripes]
MPISNHAQEQHTIRLADRLLSRTLAEAEGEGRGMASDMAPTQTHILILAPRRFAHPAWIPRQNENVKKKLDGAVKEFEEELGEVGGTEGGGVGVGVEGGMEGVGGASTTNPSNGSGASKRNRNNHNRHPVEGVWISSLKASKGTASALGDGSTSGIGKSAGTPCGAAGTWLGFAGTILSHHI